MRKSLVVYKEESAVLDNRAPERGSELILLVGLPAEEVKRISAVKLVISKKLVQVAVECDWFRT